VSKVTHLKFCRDIGTVVHIDTDKGDGSRLLNGLADHRVEHMAWSAPTKKHATLSKGRSEPAELGGHPTLLMIRSLLCVKVDNDGFLSANEVAE